MINALKWLVKFLETRFPEKVTPVAKEAFDEAVDGLDSAVRNQNKQIEEMKKQIEILNLRVGLTRATQSPFGRQSG